MAPSKKLTGLEHYRQLSRAVYLGEPAITSSQSSGPEVVLLVGWMSANPKHLAKYAAAYEELYPSARIIVVRTKIADMGFATRAQNGSRIATVIDVLSELSPEGKVLFHCFSNAGAFTSTVIAAEYLKRAGKPLPTGAVIMDSTPGRTSVEATIPAFALAMPKNPVMMALCILLIRFFFSLYLFTNFLLRRTDLVEQVRADLNDRRLMAIDTPRLYVYSLEDCMVQSEFVEEHGDDAEKEGYTVTRELFLKSGHCEHMAKDPERYWNAVESLWNSNEKA